MEAASNRLMLKMSARQDNSFDAKSLKEFDLLSLFFSEFNFSAKKEVNSYQEFCKPALGHLLSVLGLDVQYKKSIGDFIFHTDLHGNEIRVTDFLGGYGSLILGHNHPEICASAIEYIQAQLPIHAQASLKLEAGKLAEKIHSVLELKKEYIAHFLSTGTEAVEAAIKHAFLEWQEKNLRRISKRTSERAVIIVIEGGYHGKTLGSLAVTDQSRLKAMYPVSHLETLSISRNASSAEILKLVQDFGLAKEHRSLVAILVEPIQGEGGIHPLATETLSTLREIAKDCDVPFITDEIQSGLFRTGEALAGADLDPDYILLGKSLGGGLGKISACLISKERYLPAFDMLHSSTFAEDGLSVNLAIRTLELLEQSKIQIAENAKIFETDFLAGIKKIQEKYPHVISEGRGKGFFLGVEWNSVYQQNSSFAMEMLDEAGYLSYVIASFLLHRHQIRVGATLTRRNTIRIEPSAFITPQATGQLLLALEEVAKYLSLGEFGKLMSHLLHEDSHPEVENTKGARIHPQKRVHESKMDGIPHVGFLCHLISEDHLESFDPILKAMTTADRKKFFVEVSSLLPGAVCERQVLRSEQGQEIIFDLFGLAYPSEYFENSLRQRDGKGLQKIRFALHRMKNLGVKFAGLGQYSSIVTTNGRSVLDMGLPVTTGNSLTAALAIEGLKTLIEKRNRKLDDIHLGVVGPAGNICNVLTQILADEVGSLTLVHREPFSESSKYQDAVKRIEKFSKRTKEEINLSHHLSDLKSCDIILIGTNSTLPLVQPEHLKQGAIVLDVSVPTNVHPLVISERPDVDCFSGGTAKLPLGQSFYCSVLPLSNGEVFGCMAETILCGFLNAKEPYAIGPLSKEHVLKTWEKAYAAGFRLGSLKRVEVF